VHPLKEEHPLTLRPQTLFFPKVISS
jgi:hypothetical protein